MRQGDRKAFETFIDLYGGKVHRLVRRYVANPTDAEDVTQEVFVDLYRCLGSFRGESTLSTFVYRVAVNRCLRYCRREQTQDVPLDAQPEPHDSDAGSDPERCMARRELSDRVHDAVDGLPPLHQDVVILHELHGLTYRECAAILDVPVGTVKSRLSNAFRRLRDNLSGYILGDGATPQGDAIEGASQ